MKTRTPVLTGFVNLTFVKQTLLLGGILSGILYIIATILGAIVWRNYDSASQTVSELFAIDAPSAPLVKSMFIVYSMMMFAFGTGLWLSAGTKKELRNVAMLIIAKEVLGLIGAIYAPMHMRGVAGTFTDTMHIAITAIGVLLCMLPAIVYGAFAFDRIFRIYSIITILIFLLFGTLAGLEGVKIAENLPTPYAGIWERINIFSYFIWIAVLATLVMRSNMKGSSV